ncbi:MAG: hypothetical protein AAFS10_16960 [Myxococcota bacterium]
MATYHAQQHTPRRRMEFASGMVLITLLSLVPTATAEPNGNGGTSKANQPHVRQLGTLDRPLQQGARFSLGGVNYTVRMFYEAPMARCSNAGHTCFRAGRRWWQLDPLHNTLTTYRSPGRIPTTGSLDRLSAISSLHNLAIAVQFMPPNTLDQRIYDTRKGRWRSNPLSLHPAECGAWLFSNNGAYAVPLWGDGQPITTIDLRNGTTHPLPISTQVTAGTTHANWTGAYLKDRAVLFSYRYDQAAKKWHSARINVPLDDPAGATETPFDVGVDTVLLTMNDKLLVVSGDDQLQMLDTTTWTITHTLDQELNRPSTAALGPQNKLLYVTTSSGIRVYDLTQGKRIAIAGLAKDGYHANAHSLGVAPHTRWVLVPTPYERMVTVIDPNTRAVVARMHLDGAPAGAWLVKGKGKRGTMVVLTTGLPYE